MDVNVNVQRKYIVNGKEYQSIEDMPEDIREAFKKTSLSAASLTPPSVQARIIFNGTEYPGIDAMPQDIRRQYEEILKAAKTGNASGISNLSHGMSGTLTGKFSAGAPQPADRRNPATVEVSFSGRTLLFLVLLIALILALYYALNH